MLSNTAFPKEPLRGALPLVELLPKGANRSRLAVMEGSMRGSRERP